MVAYSARDQSEPIPELSPSGPSRLGKWCRTVRTVLKRAEGTGYPSHIVAKAHRVADRIAEEMKTDVSARESPTDLAGAIRQLDSVITWCERLAAGIAR